MSAFIVTKEHINMMVQAGLNSESRPFTWYHNEEKHELTRANADEVGQMLLDENIRSVQYRYEDSSIADLPGDSNADYLIPFKFHFVINVLKPIAIIKITRCLDYQSCEHPEWGASLAKAFCDALIEEYITRVAGYEDAPWEYSEPVKVEAQ